MYSMSEHSSEPTVLFIHSFPSNRPSINHSSFCSTPSSITLNKRQWCHRSRNSIPYYKFHAPQARLEADVDNEKEEQKLSPDELIARFDASIEAMADEMDDDESSDPSFEERRAERHRNHQLIQQTKREKHLRRLDILTSLPAELIVETASQKCSGCGIMLQSESSVEPGFLPTHVLDEQTANLKIPICQRCFRLTHYGVLDPQLRVLTKNAAAVAEKVLTKKRSKSKNKQTANQTENSIPVPTSSQLTPAKFRKCLQQLQSTNAVVIYLVDIFDFHGSFIPALRDTIGAKNPIILAMNKVDLLPEDYKETRVEAWIQHECRALKMYNVDSIHFISSTRGAGVAALLADALRLAKKRKADIYVVGAANVGKSSFINQLIRRRKSMGIKTKPQTAQLQLHDDSNEVNSEAVEDEIEDVNERTERNNRKKEKQLEKDTLTTSVIPGTTLDVVKIPLGPNINLFDTPGLMVSHQLTNLLGEKDLSAVVPSKSVENVSFRLSEGKCIFIGGLARVELLEGRPFFFTCFFSREVKVHPGRADEAESFTLKHVGKMLSPPSSLEGFERLGEWTSKSFTVTGQGWRQSCVDVVLSGLGWLSITGAGNARVRVCLPKNVGVFTRSPLMPYEIRQGVSSYTGGRAFNRLQVTRKKNKKGSQDDDLDFDLPWL